MLLKRLSLVGFKSFADRTHLEFDAGVNIVVGPNGSGKSNILDAIAWVMGTQATRVLRTERMDDVVFAGTVTRPPLSRAEVKLTFDNAERSLPLDLNEITITRRLFRDGTSEYELNGAACRLLDIQDLLSDGNVGRHQHVLVGQGEIGGILSAGPDEHRAVIEEAAGITKHRGRRDRSIRRLEQTDVDLERLDDILTQKRRRLRPLKRQANAAERHGRVGSELRALRLWTGGEELRRIRTRAQAAEAEYADLEAAKSEYVVETDDLRRRLDGLRSAATDAGRDLESDSRAAARMETTLERMRRITLVARERRLAIEGRLHGAGERLADLEEEERTLLAAWQESVGEAAEAAEGFERHEALLAILEDEERALGEQVSLPADGLLANLRGDLRGLEAAAQRDGRERSSLESRRAVVGERLAEEGAEASDLNKALQRTDAEVTRAQRDYEEARLDREEKQQDWSGTEEERADGGLRVARAAARVEALEAAIAGVGDPAGRLRAEAAPEVVGSVAAALDVPPDLTGAVDGALGQWRDGLVTRSRSGIKDVVEGLKGDGLGGVALVRAPTGEGALARAVAAALGIEALVDLLGKDADQDLAVHLLGDVVLVQGWDSAWSVVRRHPEVRAVTPEGDVVSASGMSVAHPDGAGSAALEAARVDLEVAERDLSRVESRYATTKRAFEQTRARERSTLEHLESLEARLAGHTEALALVGRAASESRAEIARLDARSGALRQASAAREEQILVLRERVVEMEGDEPARIEAWKALDRRRAEVAVRRETARRERDEAGTNSASAAERHRMLEERLEDVRRERAGLDVGSGDPDRDVERLSRLQEQAGVAAGVVATHIATLRDRQIELREHAGSADEVLTAAVGRLDEMERAVAETKDRVSVLAIERAELHVRDEATCEGLRRDADATAESALQAPRPDLEPDVDPEERRAALEADLRRMGPINPLAAAEYNELTSEVELLEGQLADLQGSRRDLRKVIAVLDDEMASLFIESFNEIARIYEENFVLVFPGGRGRLRLVDPNDPLGSGVEVEAQPHGKKVGRLSLLSGGERSLAALAFLFAVFRARPSPFYVLDEVEAALDDANLHRFLRLVDTLRRSAQLVIITHQQQTMSAADILYGVTMEPGASSKVLVRRMAGISA